MVWHLDAKRFGPWRDDMECRAMKCSDWLSRPKILAYSLNRCPASDSFPPLDPLEVVLLLSPAAKVQEAHGEAEPDRQARRETRSARETAGNQQENDSK